MLIRIMQHESGMLLMHRYEYTIVYDDDYIDIISDELQMTISDI